MDKFSKFDNKIYIDLINDCIVTCSKKNIKNLKKISNKIIIISNNTYNNTSYIIDTLNTIDTVNKLIDESNKFISTLHTYTIKNTTNKKLLQEYTNLYKTIYNTIDNFNYNKLSVEHNELKYKFSDIINKLKYKFSDIINKLKLYI
jgi:hypothetical protein